jgi:hypothetical protein
MKRLTVAVIVALASFGLSATAWSKGPIFKIIVAPFDSGSAIEITDKTTLDSFAIWSGPGVGGWDMAKTIPRPGDSSFIVDWTRGKLAAGPDALRRYQVVMQVEEYEPPCNRYEVIYAVSEAGQGYVYLPDWDESGGSCNQSLISRGIEGNWFHSSIAWDRVVLPLLRAGQ